MKCKHCKDKLSDYKELKKRGYCYKQACKIARKAELKRIKEVR